MICYCRSPSHYDLFLYLNIRILPPDSDSESGGFCFQIIEIGGHMKKILKIFHFTLYFLPSRDLPHEGEIPRVNLENKIHIHQIRSLY